MIAAIHGVAFGGGIQLALGADIRFVTPDARLSVMEIKWGLVPDMAGIPILAASSPTTSCANCLHRPDLLGAGGHGLWPGDAHLRRSACCSLRGRARNRRQESRTRSAPPNACSTSCRSIPAPALLAESVEQQKLLGSPNQTEAVRANMEKRAPRFAEAQPRPHPEEAAQAASRGMGHGLDGSRRARTRSSP